MGVIKRGILGGFSGRIGNVVGSSWKGIAVVKSLPLSVANPRTTAQVAQRTKFFLLVSTASTLLSYIVKPFWDRWASQMSGYNAFIQENIQNQPTDEAGLFENCVVSHGQMDPLPVDDASFDVGLTTLTVTWDYTTLGAYQSDDDIIYGVAYDPDSGQYAFASLETVRSDKTIDIVFDEAVADGDEVIYAVTARSADGFRAGTELAKKVG